MIASHRSGIDLLEESVDLLRRAPASAWSWYLAGAAPFFGALLIFWSRTTGVTAVPDPLAGALLLALLFGWRQYSRSYFASELYRMLAGTAPARHSAAAFSAVWLAGILRIPLLLVPFPAVVALFRNVSVIAPRAVSPSAAFSRAGALATRGSEQIPALLTVAGASLVVWINVFSGMLALPMLIEIFSGQQTVLMRNAQALLNGATLLASTILAWCIVDVMLASFYALRVFYGESEETGADLLGSWRRAIMRVSAVASIVICAALTLRAAEPVRPDLNRAINRVLQEKPYQWREPLANPKEQNAFVRWTDNLLESLKHSFQAVKHAWAQFVDWLRNLFGSQPARKSNAAPPFATLRALSWMAIVLLAGALAALLFRSKLLRKRLGSAAPLPAGPVAIDLEDPTILASWLPENEWIVIARDFMARGDFRMALRAYFLASLAFLASRELLAIGRSRTNLDYLREVSRRARSATGLVDLFAAGIRTFESAWYGLHDVNDSDVNRFASDLERMRSLTNAT